MAPHSENFPGGEISRRLKLAAMVAVGVTAVYGFAGNTTRAEAFDQEQNPLIHNTDIKLAALAQSIRQLARNGALGVLPPERIRYHKKGGSMNATRYVVSKAVAGDAGHQSYDHLVVIVKDGKNLPVSTGLIHGAQTYRYDQHESFKHGIIAERDTNGGMYWMEKVANSGPQPISEGMYPLVNISLEDQDQGLKGVYQRFTKQINTFIKGLSGPKA